MLICLKNKLLYVAENWLQVAVDCYCPIRLVAVTLLPKKDAKGNGMDMFTILINSIRFKSELLCSPEHSKVCFLLHETSFAAQNSLLCQGLWLSSEVSQPVHTCRKNRSDNHMSNQLN